MVILGLGYLILFLVSLVRRRVLILRIGRRLLLLRMNGVPAGRSCERSLSVVNSGVDLVALKEKIEPDRTIVAIDGKRCATQTRSLEQLCFLHLSILKSLTVIRDSFNVIFPLFVYLWGLQRRAIRTWQAYVAHHAMKLKIYATVISESMFAVK